MRFFILSLLIHQMSSLETVDVVVILFSDSNCLFRIGSAVWDTLGSCYSNIYSPSGSVGFSLEITDFTPQAEKVSLSMFSDACVSMKSTNSFSVGSCRQLIGDYYGILSTRKRSSLVGCNGITYSTGLSENGKCSDAVSVSLESFSNPTCEFPRNAQIYKSGNGQCLLTAGGSEKFERWNDLIYNSYWLNSRNCSGEYSGNISIVPGICISIGGSSYDYKIYTSKIVSAATPRVFFAALGIFLFSLLTV